ncbi:MAG: bifunctional (p)ppGpp synthetase/guanosine-3',5'-bis(diphosphate) 3'-pyrophosphohydrolase [Ignavibacteriae bacterium]|nr:MAG: bifunctional (p)ppGpp synthetase/guanosine-3',5'-bis(diphosphate) 3'-pyrophosphohydrolase [Ignavibacteriota bacterium]
MKRNGILKILKALEFAAEKHKDQRRKGKDATPYINHPIQVASLLVEYGKEEDVDLIRAALLHDTIEDTETTPDELEQHFGLEVKRLVLEVTDDKNLPKKIRKQLQVEDAPKKSDKAKMLKLSDKICNIKDVVHSPPSHWSVERRKEYLDWAEKVVKGLKGVHPVLEEMFYKYLIEGKEILSKFES